MLITLLATSIGTACLLLPVVKVGCNVTLHSMGAFARVQTVHRVSEFHKVNTPSTGWEGGAACSLVQEKGFPDIMYCLLGMLHA